MLIIERLILAAVTPGKVTRDTAQWDKEEMDRNEALIAGPAPSHTCYSLRKKKQMYAKEIKIHYRNIFVLEGMTGCSVAERKSINQLPPRNDLCVCVGMLMLVSVLGPVLPPQKCADPGT